MEKEFLVIGIAGGTGSGKTTLMKNIIGRFGDVVTVLSHDNYYYRHDELTYEQRCKINYDEPAALETDLMARHLDLLRQGESIQCPVYDFALHNRSDAVVEIEPRPIILIDGILIFHDPAMRACMDLKIYVETDADERILRRARRDLQERGRDLDSVIQQYLTTVKPMHNAYVNPTKVFADIILNGGQNEQAFRLVKTQIEQILREHEL